MSYIMMALGWLLELFYSLINNYGFAIILFTVFVKLLLFPLDLKQRRSMAKTQKIQPLLMEVQKKYANDKEKLNQETMKLYQKYGVSPMSGCLPMLIQFPIIIALYQVVRKPIIYMMGVDFDETWRIAEAYNYWLTTLDPSGDIFTALPEQIRTALTYSSSNTQNTFGQYEIQIAQVLFENPEILKHPYIAEYWAEGSLTPIDFSFFGMNLSKTPNLQPLLALFTGKVSSVSKQDVILWIIPLLSGVSSWLSGYLASGPKSKEEKNRVLAENEKPQENAAASSMKSMTLIMPIFSAWFAFNLPAAVGLYWIVSNVIQLLQQLFVKKLFTNDISLDEIEGDLENVKSRKKRKKSR